MSQFYTQHYDPFVNNFVRVCVCEGETVEKAVELLLLEKVNLNNTEEIACQAFCKRILNPSTLPLSSLHFKDEETGSEVTCVSSELAFESMLI